MISEVSSSLNNWMIYPQFEGEAACLETEKQERLKAGNCSTPEIPSDVSWGCSKLDQQGPASWQEPLEHIPTVHHISHPELFSSC